MRQFCLTLIFLASLASADQYGGLIGSPAPEWKNQSWINSKPLRLSELRGKVVLVRFFTGTACPFCRATAPALNEFHSKYFSRGLVVIGMYTPKPTPEEVPLDSVRELVQLYDFQFPVAIDNDWATLKAFWLDPVPDAGFTSVSFLIDKKGLIRLIHPGGEYSASSESSEARKDYQQIKLQIEKLLPE